MAFACQWKPCGLLIKHHRPEGSGGSFVMFPGAEAWNMTSRRMVCQKITLWSPNTRETPGEPPFAELLL